MSDIISELQQELTSTYISFSASCLFLFESVIVLSQEVDVIWRRPQWTAMTWLYAFTRYTAVVDNILLVMIPGPVGNIESCRAWEYTDQTIRLAQFLFIALFSTLRVYALSEGCLRYLMAGLTLLLNLVPFATNMFSIVTTVVVEDFDLCEALLAGSDRLQFSLSVSTRVAVIAGDVLVLAVTWMKTARSYREAQRLNIEAPLVTMLFRDGTFYFVILLAVNLLDILSHNIPILTRLGIAAPFFDTASPIIICRFILNLRKLTSGEDSSVSGNQSRSLRFVGNAGPSLQIGEEDENEDEIEPGHETAFTQPGAPPDISNETTYTAETNNGEEQSIHAQNAELEAQQYIGLRA